MIVITRYTVPAGQVEDFRARAAEALRVLGARPGFLGSRVGRAADDPELWTVVTEWEGAGYYRRALSDFEVRMAAVPLLSQARDEPTAYEIVNVPTPGGG
ncbi:antibiotic biosynthesis monooxygenase family protein [Nocardiopsis chromatogenes]|uniref:antibiotic biosynthesis monooxygenase family protein n=1 Tax=Nocardiopsis chromatogenes TaxID=280239 RepID=UPI0003486825|nr:antibiotic biosynthesis monooxygenase family protein [Nocardiopsis chromatogenes]